MRLLRADGTNAQGRIISPIVESISRIFCGTIRHPAPSRSLSPVCHFRSAMSKGATIHSVHAPRSVRSWATTSPLPPCFLYSGAPANSVRSLSMTIGRPKRTPARRLAEEIAPATTEMGHESHRCRYSRWTGTPCMRTQAQVRRPTSLHTTMACLHTPNIGCS